MAKKTKKKATLKERLSQAGQRHRRKPRASRLVDDAAWKRYGISVYPSDATKLEELIDHFKGEQIPKANRSMVIQAAIRRFHDEIDELDQQEIMKILGSA